MGPGIADALLVLEIRHVRALSVLDGRRWADRFRDDEAAPHPLGERP